MNVRKATFFMTLSALSFSLMQLFVKKTVLYPTFEQVFMRNFVIMIVMAIYIAKKGMSFKVKENKGILWLRCISGFLGIVLFFYSMKTLNLSDASALQKSSPFFVIVFSFLILKHKVTKNDIIIITMAFLGVLLVIKPNFQLAPIPSTAALLSAVFAGLAYVTISYMGDRVESMLIIFYFGLFSTLACVPFMLHNFIVPDIGDIGYLFAIGVCGGLGQLFLTKGYKLAPPGKVSIYNFLNIVFSSIFGYFIYKEKIDRLSFMGIVIILLAAIFMHYSNNKLGMGGKVNEL